MLSDYEKDYIIRSACKSAGLEKSAVSTEVLQKFLNAKKIEDITAEGVKASFGGTMPTAHVDTIKHFLKRTSVEGFNPLKIRGGINTQADVNYIHQHADNIALSGRHNKAKSLFDFNDIPIHKGYRHPDGSFPTSGHGMHEDIAYRGFDSTGGVYPYREGDGNTNPKARVHIGGRPRDYSGFEYKDVHKVTQVERDRILSSPGRKDTKLIWDPREYGQDHIYNPRFETVVDKPHIQNSIMARYKKLPSGRFQQIAGEQGVHMPSMDFGREFTKGDMYSVNPSAAHAGFNVDAQKTIPMYKNKQ